MQLIRDLKTMLERAVRAMDNESLEGLYVVGNAHSCICVRREDNPSGTEVRYYVTNVFDDNCMHTKEEAEDMLSWLPVARAADRKVLPAREWLGEYAQELDKAVERVKHILEVYNLG